MKTARQHFYAHNFTFRCKRGNFNRNRLRKKVATSGDEANATEIRCNRTTSQILLLLFSFMLFRTA